MNQKHVSCRSLLTKKTSIWIEPGTHEPQKDWISWLVKGLRKPDRHCFLFLWIIHIKRNFSDVKNFISPTPLVGHEINPHCKLVTIFEPIFEPEQNIKLFRDRNNFTSFHYDTERVIWVLNTFFRSWHMKLFSTLEGYGV